MPELPEVEILQRQLGRAVKGKKIVGIKVLRSKSFQGEVKDIIGKKILAVGRRAKLLILSLAASYQLPVTSYLMIHLKLTGQLIYQKKDKSLSKHTRVIINFKDGSKLYFNDQRVFGWMKIINNSKLKTQMSKLGIEPLNNEFTEKYLQKIFFRTRRPIKLVLMDQSKIAGIGNIYANDALFLAGVDPRKPAKALKEKEIVKLRQAIVKVLKDGIKYGGASENTYRHLDGLGGNYQEHFLVYQQDGKKCRKCGNLIKRIKIGGRGTFFCPKCQK